MSNEKLRQTLTKLLRGGNAHATLEQALKDLPPNLRHQRPEGLPYSVWELLEHMRIAQTDILHYTLDPSYQSPKWPEGYWPNEGETLSEERWERTLEGFKGDLEAVIHLIEDSSRSLTDEIPHGEGRTYLRQVLLVADHNAYHLGQIVVVRRALGDWS